MELHSYFVETHEINFDTGMCDLLEYVQYNLDASDWACTSELGCLHHTILTSVVF